MKLALILLRVLVAGVLSGWILLLWLGIDSWQTGIGELVHHNTRVNSFPFEEFGRRCIWWACIWGFLSCVGFTFWCMHTRTPINSMQPTPVRSEPSGS